MSLPRIGKQFLICVILCMLVGLIMYNIKLRESNSPREMTAVNLLGKDKFLLILVTTWKLSVNKMTVYENTAHIWSSWPLLVQPVLYRSTSLQENVNSSRLDMYLRKHWKINNILNVACGEIPVLKSMVLDVLSSFTEYDFYGYANGDILFDQSLIKTMKSIKENIPQNKPILVIGQRINVNFTSRRHVSNSDSIHQIAERGVLMKTAAIDYFITNQKFPWHLVLDLVIGRIQYDNWLVYFAISQNVTVIDATHTLTAVHQTTMDGNDAGFHHSNLYCNKDIIDDKTKRFKTIWGYIWCAPYYTIQNPETNGIVIRQRKVSPSCKP